MAEPPRLSRQVSDLRLETEFLQSSTEHLIQGAGRGSIIQRWRSQDQTPILGQGSYGVVRLERSESDPVTLRAVKQIKKSDPNGNAIEYARELEAIVRFSHSELKHRFVCSSGWFEDEASIFIVMEYLMNGDLSHHINNPLPESEVTEIIGQILEGLGHMHDHGFIHRDLKPGNIMVAAKHPSWEVKIADFGVSKERHLASISPNTFYVGTLGYAAPEQLAVGKLPDSSVHGNEADLWSVGIITFRILTGKLPFLDTQALSRYTFGKIQFPVDQLDSVNASRNAERFIRGLLVSQPHERMSARASLAHPWMGSRVASEGTQLSLRSTESVHSHSSNTISQVSEMPSARWSNVWDSTPIPPDTIQPEKQREQPRKPGGPPPQSPSITELSQSSQLPSSLSSNTNKTTEASQTSEKSSEDSLPSPQFSSTDLLPERTEMGGALKRYLRAAQIGVAKKLVDSQKYQEAVPSLKQLLSISSELDETQKASVAGLGALAFIETLVPIEEIEKYFNQNESFKSAYLELSIQKSKERCAAETYQEASPWLKQLLESYDHLTSNQKDIVLNLAAMAFIESGVRAESTLKQNEDFRVVYDRMRVQKVEEWFTQNRHHDIINLLKEYQALKLPPWSRDQSFAYLNIDEEIRLRMRLAACLDLTGDAQQARSILENLLVFMANSHDQRAPVHIMVSETLISSACQSEDPKWKVFAKNHAEEAANLYMDSVGLASPGTLKAATLVAGLSEELGDEDQDAWEQILADVKHHNRLAEIKKFTSEASKFKRKKHAQALVLCQTRMIEASHTNPDRAVEIALNYLKSNFFMGNAQNFCEKCAEEYFRRSDFSWTAATPPEWTACQHDPKIKMVFSPLHFFACAFRKESSGSPPHCTQEVACILDMAGTEPISNNAISYGGQGSDEITPITPLWVAAFWGEMEVVNFFLSRKDIDINVGSQSIKRLGFYRSAGGEKAIIAVLRRMSRAQLDICLRESAGEMARYPYWPWCFATKEILHATLEKLGPSSGGIRVPWRFQSEWEDLAEEVDCSLLIILLAFPVAITKFPMPRQEALEVLLRYGADIQSTGPKLKLERQPATLNAVNALGLGLNDAIRKLEVCSTTSGEQTHPGSKQGIERNRLYNEIKTSVAMTHHVIKTLPSFTPDGIGGDKYVLPDPHWNNYWSDVTKQFFHLESQTRLVRQRDRLLHLMARPKRLRLDIARFPISLPERVPPYKRLGLPPNPSVPQNLNEDWVDIAYLRNLLENDIAEVLRKIGWIDQTVLFDRAGPFS
ncbi:unnamed protein product [Clonostachys rosea f. rosea IK726]|uniref:Uncharacterized protein n=1 Tax=Clonostachys rosea f. rosea IK726 TaxID=1349383 RepID=A0ACA9TY66_BIOOC|nr:unnamed protein product [Clonostachys rosea f. rosea IK726]